MRYSIPASRQSDVISTRVLKPGGIALDSPISNEKIPAITGIFAKSALLIVLSTLVLSASIGARTGYYEANYFLIVQEPTITIGLFSLLAITCYRFSKHLSVDHERLAIASARTGILLVNFGFWIGSLWGEESESGNLVAPDYVFSVGLRRVNSKIKESTG